MTIDEAILDLTELKICGVVPFTKGTISGGNYKVITEECLNTAIETMRKYQKMQGTLDKIREEMFEEILSHSGTGEEVIQAYADGLKKGLDFLDKYKAESEK